MLVLHILNNYFINNVLVIQMFFKKYLLVYEKNSILITDPHRTDSEYLKIRNNEQLIRLILSKSDQ
jgi:hypothetical protein